MTQDFVDAVKRAGGFATVASAARAVDAALEALGARLVPAERDLLAASLPQALAARLASAGGQGQLDVEDIVREVADREDVPPATAREHLEVVLSILAERLDAETRARLEGHLPPAVLALLGPLPVTAAAAAPTRPVRSGHTLASGRPGSEHPLSEARSDCVQAQSVAAENPHGDTKLSSTSGTSQERAGETLAAGMPGSQRPVSDGEE